MYDANEQAYYKKLPKEKGDSGFEIFKYGCFYNLIDVRFGTVDAHFITIILVYILLHFAHWDQHQNYSGLDTDCYYLCDLNLT